MKLEEQLLPHPDLKPLHDQAIWLYVYRTFQKDDADRAAERISIRFGVTSWPQLFLVDPVTLKILAHTGRTVASFQQAFSSAPSVPQDPARRAAAATALVTREATARLLETGGTLEAALPLLDDDDIVVRTRALEVVAGKAPQHVVQKAVALLATPNDPFRYLVCEVLAKAADPRAKEALEALVRDPKDSLNPNVLRIRAVQALATCGDASSIEALAPHAASGVYFNGLTGIAIDALAAIATRQPEARVTIAATLRTGYPEPPQDADARTLRACTALARRIHTAVGDPRPFPEPYDAAARAALMEAPQ